MKTIDISNNCIHIYKKEKKLHKEICDFIIKQSIISVRNHGRCTISLAGGGTPKPIYERLAKKRNIEKMPWSKTKVFWGDERFVGPENDESNLKMARKALLDKVPIPKGNIYPIPTHGSPADAASLYEETIREQFKSRPPQFDLMLLGLGDDGHTASLFPNTQVLHETTALVREVFHPVQQKFRISLTAEVINASNSIIFIVQGKSKAKAVFEVLNGEENIDLYPAQLISRGGGRVHWFLDKAAASEL